MPNLATWFSPSLQTFSRAEGRSAVISAAYRACANLIDERLGKSADFRPKGVHGLVCNVCVGIPEDDIEKLWNDAERAENRANSTVARELMLPLAHEWNDYERRECVHAIAQMLRDDYGVAVMASIHRPDFLSPNDHVHMMFTTRTVDEAGIFGKKTRVLDDAKTGEVKKLREKICAIVNEHAVKAGSDWYAYAGKFADVMPDHIPTHHISPAYGERQKEFIERNRSEVREARQELAKIRVQVQNTEKKIASLQTQMAQPESPQNTAPTLADANEGGRVKPEPKVVLTRIAMPENVQAAMDRKNKAGEVLPKYQKMAERHAAALDALEKNRPNFLVRFFTGYDEKLKTAKEQLEQSQSSLTRVAAIGSNAGMLQLCEQYHLIIDHNVRVGIQEEAERKLHALRLAEEAAAQKEIERQQTEEAEQRQLRQTIAAIEAFQRSHGDFFAPKPSQEQSLSM